MHDSSFSDFSEGALFSAIGAIIRFGNDFLKKYGMVDGRPMPVVRRSEVSKLWAISAVSILTSGLFGGVIACSISISLGAALLPIWRLVWMLCGLFPSVDLVLIAMRKLPFCALVARLLDDYSDLIRPQHAKDAEDFRPEPIEPRREVIETRLPLTRTRRGNWVSTDSQHLLTVRMLGSKVEVIERKGNPERCVSHILDLFQIGSDDFYVTRPTDDKMLEFMGISNLDNRRKLLRGDLPASTFEFRFDGKVMRCNRTKVAARKKRRSSWEYLFREEQYRGIEFVPEA